MFHGIKDYIMQVAGATLTGAAIIKNDISDVSICWDGGRYWFTPFHFPPRLTVYLIISRHHAEKARASGFCYVADCILAILFLKRTSPSTPLGKKPRVMYLDLDLHFSDAVSQAFHKPGSVTASQVLVCASLSAISHRLIKLFSDALYSSRCPRLFPCFPSCLSPEGR